MLDAVLNGAMLLSNPEASNFEALIFGLLLITGALFFPVFFLLVLVTITFKSVTGEVPNLLRPIHKFLKLWFSDIPVIGFIGLFIVFPVCSAISIVEVYEPIHFAYQFDKKKNAEALESLQENVGNSRYAAKLLKIYGYTPENFSSKIDYYRILGSKELLDDYDQDVMNFFATSIDIVLPYEKYYRLLSKQDKENKPNPSEWTKIVGEISGNIQEAVKNKNSVEVIVEGDEYLKKAEYYWSGATKDKLEKFLLNKIIATLGHYIYLLGDQPETKLKISIMYTPSDLSVRSYKSSQIAKPYIAAIPNIKWRVALNNRLIEEGEKRAGDNSPTVGQELQFVLSKNAPEHAAKKELITLLKSKNSVPSNIVKEEIERRFGKYLGFSEDIWW